MQHPGSAMFVADGGGTHVALPGRGVGPQLEPTGPGPPPTLAVPMPVEGVVDGASGTGSDCDMVVSSTKHHSVTRTQGRSLRLINLNSLEVLNHLLVM